MYTLSNHDIEKISCEITSIMESARVSPQGCTKVRLTTEELLLRYQEKFGSETELTLLRIKRFGKITFTMKIRCDSFNPITNFSEEDFWLQNILQYQDFEPTWKYKNSCNELSFLIRCESRFPACAGTLFACGLGIIGGLATHLLSGEKFLEMTAVLFDPVSSAIMGFLNIVSAMLIFLSIINSIIGMGNLATLNRIGKKLISRIMLSMFVLGIIMVILFGLIFPISGGVGGGFDLGSLWKMIIDIIPNSFFEPFNSGNALQILFLAFVIGFIMLRSSEVLDPVVNVVQGLYQIVQDMMALVLKVLPLVVFISLFNLFSCLGDINLRIIYKFPLLQLILTIVWLAAVILKICVKHKVKPMVLVKKLMPAYVIGISTASSNAALSESMNTCEKNLGISSKLVKLGIPLSHTINKPTAMILIMSGTMCMAQMFSIDISWSALVTMTLTVFLLAIAAPPVPGGGVSVTMLLFNIYGIPIEALSIIISLDVITDRIVTSSIVTNSQLSLIQVADSLGELDVDVLKS